MNNNKMIIKILGLFCILIISTNVNALEEKRDIIDILNDYKINEFPFHKLEIIGGQEAIFDPVSDVWHIYFDENMENMSWESNISDRPNCDISEISMQNDGEHLIFTLKVCGEIANSDNFYYQVICKTVNAEYMMAYCNGGFFGIGINNNTYIVFDSGFCYGNILVGVCEELEKNTSVVEFYAIVYEFNEIDDFYIEYWIDWVPNEYINSPPNIPAKPSGPTTCKPGIEYVFTTSTTEYDGDNIYYLFDWGDGTDSGWLGPFKSGETIEAFHTWNNQGVHDIKVRAKDNLSFENAWSEPLHVHIAKTSFLFGKIGKLITAENIITFNAVNLRFIQSHPFCFIPYLSGEQITISKDYKGLVGSRFIFAICSAST